MTMRSTHTKSERGASLGVHGRPGRSSRKYTPRPDRRGVAGPWVVVAMVDIADSAALAGGTRLPHEDKAIGVATRTVIANNDTGNPMKAICSSEDIEFFLPGETIPGYGDLGVWAYAIRVTARVPVEYTFARILGISGAVATRSCTVMRAPAKGVPMCTIWLADGTERPDGEPQSLLMATGPEDANIPGSFGFLQSPDGCTATWDTLLKGYPMTYEDMETSFVEAGDSVFATTGVDVGLFTKALLADKGTARLERGTTGKWEFDTFDDYHADNPRIMLIPMVTYLGGTGSNAEFRIERFAAFWLDAVQGGQKILTGRFMNYDLPGGDANGGQRRRPVQRQNIRHINAQLTT